MTHTRGKNEVNTQVWDQLEKEKAVWRHGLAVGVVAIFSEYKFETQVERRQCGESRGGE